MNVKSKAVKVMLVVVIAAMLMAASPMQEAKVDLNGLLYQAVEAILKLAVAAIGIYGAYLLNTLQSQVQVEIGEKQYEWLKDYISQNVSAVAQNPAIAGVVTPEGLQHYVIQEASEFCVQKKLPFTDTQITGLVEAAVKMLKDSTGYSATRTLELSNDHS